MDTESPRDLARPQVHARRRQRVVLAGGAVAIAAALLAIGMAMRLGQPTARSLGVATPVTATSMSTTTSTTVPPARLTPVSPVPTEPTTTAPTTTTPATAAAPVPSTPITVPEPVLVVFDRDDVTLEGAVPSEEARAYLETLAAANAKGAAIIDNRVTIDPAVPLDVPVRVIELQSARFPSGSADVLPDHGVELDRVANVMLAFPHVTLLVVGHADQVGSDAANLELSQARAVAVVNHLIAKGVAADRLSARGVGETDLLADDLGADALALNRRTEFVFTGILLPR